MSSDSQKSKARLRTEKLQERTFLWARGIVETCPRHYRDDPSRTIWRQLVRAAPSAASNLDEADEAASENDFLYRMRVALREAKEASRWLRFIVECRLQHYERLEKAADEARQLALIFAAIVRNTERRLGAEREAGRSRRGC